ncbi:uncharacterized protein [Solanum lycopersicum]|uniref:uncharacterized protein n=1 Tax=Solanum lycopersicum TaxID=4081 RepID=UPI000532BDA4|nr:octapeptide-repeat protein T2-like [Solanum lycopersicum]
MGFEGSLLLLSVLAGRSNCLGLLMLLWPRLFELLQVIAWGLLLFSPEKHATRVLLSLQKENKGRLVREGEKRRQEKTGGDRERKKQGGSITGRKEKEEARKEKEEEEGGKGTTGEGGAKEKRREGRGEGSLEKRGEERGSVRGEERRDKVGKKRERGGALGLLIAAVARKEEEKRGEAEKRERGLGERREVMRERGVDWREGKRGRRGEGRETNANCHPRRWLSRRKKWRE